MRKRFVIRMFTHFVCPTMCTSLLVHQTLLAYHLILPPSKETLLETQVRNVLFHGLLQRLQAKADTRLSSRTSASFHIPNYSSFVK